MQYIKNQVFIGMQFAEMDDIYQVIKAACTENFLNPIRVDELTNSNSIIDDVKKLIEDAEFIIIDLTHNNANVYYELGYADGVGNEACDILLTAKIGTNLHFDTRHRRVNFYKDAYDLQNILKEKLPKFIEEGRK